jgi:hypothetical protein
MTASEVTLRTEFYGGTLYCTWVVVAVRSTPNTYVYNIVMVVVIAVVIRVGPRPMARAVLLSAPRFSDTISVDWRWIRNGKKKPDGTHGRAERCGGPGRRNELSLTDRRAEVLMCRQRIQSGFFFGLFFFYYFFFFLILFFDVTRNKLQAI